MAESAEILERSSQVSSPKAASDTNTSNNRDAFKLVEEYSRQNELKAREMEQLTAKMSEKKDKMAGLKKEKADLVTKLQRVESKLQNMSKFSHIFIKSIKQQNLSLKSQVEKQKQDFEETFAHTCTMIQQQIAARVS